METGAAQENGETDGIGDMWLPNPHLLEMDRDILYHIGMATNTHNLPELFGDVKFVCIGGQSSRMCQFAAMMSEELGQPLPEGQLPKNYAAETDRYAVFKAGAVLAVSHGIGFSSLSVVLHEIFKLIRYAKCRDVKIIRIGTCGGLGLEPGTVVVSRKCVDGMLNDFYEMPVLGKMVRRYAVPDSNLIQELLNCSKDLAASFPTVSGSTMSVIDFYEGQARLDGAICEYEDAEKMEYLQRMGKSGVVNIEMEALLVTVMCHKAGISSAVVCVTLLDRLKEDQLTSPPQTMKAWQQRPQILVAHYIKRQLGLL